MSYSPDDPALRAEVDASLERWDKLRAEHAEWTGDMLMAIAELCTVFSVALTAKFGVPVHVSFDPAPIEPLVVRRTPAEWCTLTGIEIVDHDGWRGVHSDRAWTDPIVREEFLARARICTARWPIALHDEAAAADPCDYCNGTGFDKDEDAGGNWVPDRSSPCPVCGGAKQ